tara:strand:- start:272 stop:655 length:384 start_codon:yes stop_codon:yes gene_type:complete
MSIEKILNSLFKKLETYESRIELQELCVLFYINEKDTATHKDIVEKFFSTLSSAQRRISTMGNGYKFRIPNGEQRTSKGLKLIDEKKYSDNVIKIDGSDWQNKEYVITKKGKKLIDEIKKVFKGVKK